jgi:hypothetical protein
MTPLRFSIIRGNIARLLHAAKPMLCQEAELSFSAKMAMSPPPTQGEFDHVIQRMEQAGQIIRHRTEDEGVKTKLTEVGEAELLK